MKRQFTLAMLLAISCTGIASAEHKTYLTQPSTANPQFTASQDKGVAKADVLVISCMDYRLRTELENYMVHLLGPDSYDEVALPGAALGVLNDHFPLWNQTFTQSLDLAISLHGVKRVIFMDHEDCGAYKLIIGKDCCTDLVKEDKAHAAQMDVVRKFMQEKYPAIKVDTWLMKLDGTVQDLGPKNPAAAIKLAQYEDNASTPQQEPAAVGKSGS